MPSEFKLHSHLSQCQGKKKHLATHLAFNETQEFVFKLRQHEVGFFVRQFYRN